MTYNDKIMDLLFDDPNFHELMKEFSQGQVSQSSLHSQLEVIMENIRVFLKECSGKRNAH